MKKHTFLTIALIITISCCTVQLVCGQTENIISQTNSDYIYFEAEDYSELHGASDGGSFWIDNGTELRSNGNVASTELEAAKAVYKFNFISAGTYMVYARVKTVDVSDDVALYVSDEEGSPYGSGRISTPGIVNFTWLSLRTLTFSTGGTQTIVIFPDLGNVIIDQLLLHKTINFTSFDIDALPLVSSLGVSSSADNLIAFAPVEGGSSIEELTKSGGGELRDSPVGDYFPYSQGSFYEIDGAQKSISFTFPDLECYTSISGGDAELCFRWMSPTYQSFSGSVDWTITYNKSDGTTLTQNGALSNVGTNGKTYQVETIDLAVTNYTENITSTTFEVEVTGDVNDVIWLDHIELKLNDPGGMNEFSGLTINNLGIVSVSDPLINFNPSTIPTVSTDRIDRFEWDFGDGNSRIITDTDELPITHTYTTNGDYTVTLTVFDNVGVAAAPACAMVGAAATKTETVTVSRVGLPVELADFKGEIKEEGIFIEWETATEINNDYFVLEHSTDGKNFLRLATIDGNLNSIVRQNYEYLHRSPKKGWNYYRLQQVDTDGTFTIEAPIISFEWKIDSDIIISPNPAQDRLFLRGVNTGMDYLIFNALGQIKLSGLAQEGQEILIEELPNGVYWLQLFSGNERGEVFQFLKK